jgi:hypothetical protein
VLGSCEHGTDHNSYPIRIPKIKAKLTCPSLSQSTNCLPSLKSECSLPCSQEPATDSYLSQMNPIRIFPPCFPKIHSNIILPFTFRSSEWLCIKNSKIRIWRMCLLLVRVWLSIFLIPLCTNCMTVLFSLTSNQNVALRMTA